MAERFDYGEKRPDGQYPRHPVLSEAERARGFVRPVRLSYRHVGVRPQYETRDLTPDERERYTGQDYVAFEAYPRGGEGASSVTGRFWTEVELRSGCGVVTTMARALGETYARQPNYYGKTFCSDCGDYFPVGEKGEFVWLDDGTRVGA